MWSCKNNAEEIFRGVCSCRTVRSLESVRLEAYDPVTGEQVLLFLSAPSLSPIAVKVCAANVSLHLTNISLDTRRHARVLSIRGIRAPKEAASPRAVVFRIPGKR